MTNNIVITGPPSSGKSTIIKELSVNGYNTVPETASMNIERSKIGFDRSGTVPQKDGRIEDVVSTLKFQNSITTKQLIAESQNGIHDDSTLILDRSLIDNIAYRKYLDVPVGEKLKQVVQNRYDKVLFFEALELDESGARYEKSKSEQKEIEHILFDTYDEYDIDNDDMHTILECGVESRLEMVIDHIEDRL